MSRAVSPELVLVDPDLARAERERLLEGARLALIVAETRVAPSPSRAATAAAPHPRWREALLPGIALVSLVANIVLASLLVARRIDVTSSSPAVPVRTASVEAAPTTKASRTAPRPVRIGRAHASAVELHVFEWLVRAPAASLPKALVGAGRPGGPSVSARCAARAPKSYRCSLRVGGKRLRRTLLVEFPAPAEGGARIQWAPR